MAQSIPHEAYSDFWRARALQYLDGDKASWSTDSSAKSLLELLLEKRTVLLEIIDNARTLSETLRQQTLQLVCCHGDLHSGNFLVDKLGTIHPVDWDTLSLAPKEKDLMFLGGGIGGMLDDKEGTPYFYEGYGRVEVNLAALTYFRLERIVQDVVAYCEQLLETSEGGEDRATMLRQVISQFEKGGVVDIAYNTNDILEAE